MIMQQANLRASDGRVMTTWLNKRAGLKRGAMIELDGMPDIIWRVTWLYDALCDSELLDMNRGWTNNI